MLSRKLLTPVVIVVATFLGAGAAHADSHLLKQGKKIFNRCKSCHEVAKEKNKIGPHLVGLFGRKAGSVAGYRYSKAMKASGIVWDEKTLDAFLTNPKKAVPKNKMPFGGLKKEKQRQALLAYLKSATKK